MSNKTYLGFIILIVLIFIFIAGLFFLGKKEKKEKKITLGDETEIILSEPEKKSNTSVEEAILKRRSIREYKDEPLGLKEISQILWSAQGITEPNWGGRTAPSAGALYPLEVYLVVKKAENLRAGVYHYLPKEHKLKKILEGDIISELVNACLGQSFVGEAPVILVFTAIFERTTKKYGQRGIGYVYMEVGHAAQNVYLQAQSLGLGTVTVGAFDEEKIKEIIRLKKEETPLYLMPIGKKP